MLDDIKPRFVLIVLTALGISTFIAFTVFPSAVSVQVKPQQLSLLEDKSNEEICSVLQLQLKSLSKSNLQSETISPDEKLSINALYYWKTLNCPKVLSGMLKPNDSDAVVKRLEPKIKSNITAAHITDSAKIITSTTKVQAVSYGKDNLGKESPNKCHDMKTQYYVVPGISWGSLPTDLQKEWTTLECDKLNKDVPVHDNKEVKLSTKETDGLTKDLDEVADLKAKIKADKGQKVKTFTAGLPRVSGENAKWCFEARANYQVVPMHSWGKLTADMIELWKSRKCDIAFTAIRLSKISLATCLDPTDSSKSSISDFTDKYYSSLPLIAIMAASTTRKMPNPSIDSIALFLYMLPSLIRTIDCKFRYVYVLGYDKGDPFYDSEEGMLKVKKWFRKNVELPMKANGIMVTLRTVKVNNTLKKPGPVFNEMARQAYKDGADYFYRINDDTEMIHHWPTLFVNTLQHLQLPYGVVGPKCDQGNTNILTHDFVHRTHMEIFEMNYYPPQLTDWWMDDWISYVYGKHRTFKAKSSRVMHHTGVHGQRYEVDGSNANHLKRLLSEGRSMIRKWMLTHGATDQQLKVFDGDVFHVFEHKDIPESVMSI